MASIENKVITEIQMRAIKGENKYGTTMDRDDLNLHEWLQHLKEELMDATVYVQKLQDVAREDYEEFLLKTYKDE